MEQPDPDRKVYTVAAFNRGVASWLERLPTLWVEGEVTELRRQRGWINVFFTLKDPRDGACLRVAMPRNGFDALRLELTEGAAVQVFGRPVLYESRGEFWLRALTIEPVGLGAVLARLEYLKRTLAAEGLFARERKRALPLLPRRIGLLTGADAAAKRDFTTAVAARFPAARVLVVETVVQGPSAPAAIVAALASLAAEPEVDVVVVSRGGGSFEDLLAFSDERVVRAVAACPVPVVSAVGHEQDTPLCDLAADARASTPTAAARLVVPDEQELRERLDGLQASLRRSTLQLLERSRRRLTTPARTDAAARAQAGRARRPRRPPPGAVAAGHARAGLRDRPLRSRHRARPGRRRARRAGRRRGRARTLRRAGRVSAEPVSFEDARRELERIVRELESGQADLERAVALWERGQELYRLCVARLDAAQGKVESLPRNVDR
jgi:exodeoxyribonuclease VII large subunit